MTLASFAKRLEKFAIDNSPAILTALGVTGTLTTAYLTGQATIKAVEILKKENGKLALEGARDGQHPPNYDISTRRKVELVWKEYIPAIGMAGMTITCIVGANRIGSRRAAALATAYSVSEKAFTEYKSKVIEKIGENKEQAVRDEIAQDRVNQNPLGQREVVLTGSGDVLCYDGFTGRYFTSNMERLRKAENEINFQVLHNSYASLSDFYEKIGLAPTSASEEVGWNCDKMLEMKYSTTLSEDSRPCIAIDFVVAPIRGYYRLQ